MNKINKLFDNKFALDYLRKKLLPFYPTFSDIKKIKIIPHKNLVWERTYHVVIEFEVSFINADKKITNLPIFCSAHSSEIRLNSYKALKFLWFNGFSAGRLTTAHPLFFSRHFNALFYRGLRGHHLHYYIGNHLVDELEILVQKVAKWLAKLHKLDTKNAYNFNANNSRVKTVTPGTDFVLTRIKQEHKKFYSICSKIYKQLTAKEEKFFSSSKQRWLIHGDAHPENFIKISREKIGAIDFTDICLSDFARDLGSFLQQLDYMLGKHDYKKIKINSIKKLFLNTYLAARKIKLDAKTKDRIKNYYNFTAMRTATYYLTRENPNEAKAERLLKIICKNLNIKFNIKTK